MWNAWWRAWPMSSSALASALVTIPAERWRASAMAALAVSSARARVRSKVSRVASASRVRACQWVTSAFITSTSDSAFRSRPMRFTIWLPSPSRNSATSPGSYPPRLAIRNAGSPNSRREVSSLIGTGAMASVMVQGSWN